jgi:hypothetical protein
LPDEFVEYISMCRNYSFDEEPNYEVLINKFKGLFIASNYDRDKIEWDWDAKLEEQSEKSTASNRKLFRNESSMENNATRRQ